MTLTVLEPEGLYPDTSLEQGILGPDVRILQGNAKHSLAELPDSLMAEAVISSAEPCRARSWA